MSEQETITQQAEGTPSASAATPAPFRTTGDGLVSTVERIYPSPAQEAGPQAEGEEQALDDGTLMAELETPGAPGDGDGASREEELPYTDITTLTKEEIAEWQAEDPVGYAANLTQQIAYEVGQKNQREAAEVRNFARVVKTFQSYERENPEFRKMWDDSKQPIQKFMAKHPGHNAISAYILLTGRKGVPKALSTSSSPAPSKSNAPAGSDLRMKDPKKFGGVDQVLVARLRERRGRQG
jgi:hypothetical protein